MAEEPDYIDRTILRLRREYSKDELVAALNKLIKEKDIEIGKLNSEIQHLEAQLNLSDEERIINFQAKKEVRQQQLYRTVLDENNRIRKELKKIIIERDKLLYKINGKL